MNLGQTTTEAQRALVDSGVSANFMSEELYNRITGSGVKFTVGIGGWIQVMATGLQSDQERRRTVSMVLEIGCYSRTLKFTVFSGL